MPDVGIFLYGVLMEAVLYSHEVSLLELLRFASISSQVGEHSASKVFHILGA